VPADFRGRTGYVVADPVEDDTGSAIGTLVQLKERPHPTLLPASTLADVVPARMAGRMTVPCLGIALMSIALVSYHIDPIFAMKANAMWARFISGDMHGCMSKVKESTARLVNGETAAKAWAFVQPALHYVTTELARNTEMLWLHASNSSLAEYLTFDTLSYATTAVQVVLLWAWLHRGRLSGLLLLFDATVFALTAAMAFVYVTGTLRAELSDVRKSILDKGVECELLVQREFGHAEALFPGVPPILSVIASTTKSSSLVAGAHALASCTITGEQAQLPIVAVGVLGRYIFPVRIADSTEDLVKLFVTLASETDAQMRQLWLIGGSFVGSGLLLLAGYGKSAK